jgi:hypothetical protein
VYPGIDDAGGGYGERMDTALQVVDLWVVLGIVGDADLYDLLAGETCRNVTHGSGESEHKRAAMARTKVLHTEDLGGRLSLLGVAQAKLTKRVFALPW